MDSAPLIGISIGTLNHPTSGSTFLAVRPTYPHAVALAGGIPVMIPTNLDDSSLRAVFDRLDGLVLSGGGDVDPQHYGADCSPYTEKVKPECDETHLRLAKWAVEADKPLLAICRGLQVLNVALGGTLIQDIRDEVPGALRHDAQSDAWFPRLVHDVEIVPGTQLHAALGGHTTMIKVNSLHHQAAQRIGEGLEAVGCATDGIIEGLEHPARRFVVGVQWHPEALADQHAEMRQLFTSLLSAARNGKPA